METLTVKTCTICLSNLDEKKDYCITECSHEFHTSCLFQSRNRKCPLCRDNIVSKNKLIESSVGLPNTSLSTRRIVTVDLEVNEDNSVYIHHEPIININYERDRTPSPNILDDVYMKNLPLEKKELFEKKYKSKRNELLKTSNNSLSKYMKNLPLQKQELFKSNNIN